MQDITLKLEERTVTGKQVRGLRRDGMVPAVIHDHGKESRIVMASYVDITKAYQAAGKHHPVQLEVGKDKYMALIKDADFGPRKRELRHLVFNAVAADEKVEAEIPVQIVFDEGNDASPAERAGLIVLHNMETVEVEALPKDLPDVLTFSGESIVEAGDQATVADLKVPAGVTILTDENQVLATAHEPSALQAANEALEGEGEEPGAAEAEAEEGAIATEGEASAEAPAAEAETAKKTEE